MLRQICGVCGSEFEVRAGWFLATRWMDQWRTEHECEPMPGQGAQHGAEGQHERAEARWDSGAADHWSPTIDVRSAIGFAVRP